LAITTNKGQEKDKGSVGLGLRGFKEVVFRAFPVKTLTGKKVI
jgi:hypothetical protein